MVSWPRSEKCRTSFSFYHSYFPCTIIQSFPEHSTLLQIPPLWLILQTTLIWRSMTKYDVGWRSTFHEFPGLSTWLIVLRTIYYRLYGIKYKYRVVAILYPSLVFVYSLTNIVSLSSLVQFELCALIYQPWTLYHWTFVLQYHSLTHAE